SASQPILFQNTPNPHKGTCVIRYFVPSLNQKAEVQFFDMYGQWLRTVPITSEGMGQLNIDATDLASGSYAYSLVIADKVIDTKVMIKE
ncbi:MAG: T9SS type A sorting domain-containing protein, partial [Flavobacteriales bacterium]|nr:T9SS type A sorting domain-containing protein [Flavobacteriales bacterium]